MKTMTKWMMVAAVAVGGAALATPPAFACPKGAKVSTRASDKDVSESMCLVNGVAHGPTRAVTADGKTLLWSGEYVNGRSSGHWLYFDKEGKKLAEIDFKDGSYSGSRVEFFTNGQKRFEETWLNGALQGTAKYFDQTGAVSPKLVTGN